MISIDSILFVAGLLLLLGIASSKVASRVGMPVLVLFLAVGMLAGSEGLGGIAFENYDLANSIGTIALGAILFDGGLRTPLRSLRAAWKPALVLATLGVVVAALLTGAAAAWMLQVPLVTGMLLGAIIGSTDAAAVFSVLRTSGLRLPERLTATLEVESGSNDPMAIFLTLALIGLISGTAASAGELLMLFARQFGIGTVVGIGGGLLAARAINRIRLDHAGLYPVLALALGLLTFGVAALLGGSGFLAIYLAGIALGNSPIVFRNGIFLFQDAAAWLGQIMLFVMLGMLAFPSRLLAVAPQGVLLALVLIVIARPISVALSLLPFGFRPREQLFISWAGLKGAVPITLATFPLTAGLPNAELIFNVVFFAVLVSAITQGWSLPTLARALRLGSPAGAPPPITVEINALRHVDGEIVDYTVNETARVVGVTLRDLALPDGVVVALMLRDGVMVMPRGATTLRPGDHLYVATRRRLLPFVNALFDATREPIELPTGLKLDFQEDDTAEQIRRFFYIPKPSWPSETVGEMIERGATHLGPFRLIRSEEPEFVTLLYEGEEGDAGDAGDNG